MSRNDPETPGADDRERALALLRRHGRDVTSFQLLEPGFRYFFAEDGLVAYVDTKSAWVAGGGPVAPPDRLEAVARAFVSAAKERGLRASFFAVGPGFEARGFPRVRVGEQPFWDPRRWDEVVREHASLRYQLRRARAKGVSVRQVDAGEMSDPGSATRRAVEGLVDAWLGARPLAPMGFLVDVEPFDFPGERLYFVAEREDRVIAFLNAVPIYARRGWFIEDLLRASDAPNGTAELLVDHAMRAAAERGSELVSMGLAPLAGHVPRRLRVARAVSRPLYDFRGLHAFKAKLRPHGWEPIDVAAAPHGSPWVALFDGLRAFARGSMLRFGLETFARGPVAVLWALSLLLVVWTPLLALAPARLFPSPGVQAAWVAFDVALALALLSLCRTYRPRLGEALVVLVSADAALTLLQAALYNAPRAVRTIDWIVIAVACAGPVLGALALRGSVRRRREVQP